jgi:hypothetical protein
VIRTLFSTTAASLILAGASLGLGAPAQAQMGVEIGPGGVRTYQERPQVEPRVIERRSPGRRVVIEEDANEEVCETRTRRVRVDGVWRTRRVRVCE